MPPGELEPIPRSDLRASDADREAVAKRLQEAAADGRLDLAELDDRLGAAYEARTFGQLDAVVRDLGPEHRAAHVVPAHGTPGSTLSISAMMNDAKREGVWHVPAEIIATAGMGSVKLDFTQAVLATDEVHVEAVANAGSVVLLVPQGWRVEVDGVSSGLGTVRNKAVAPTPGSPTLRVTGRATMGDVVVRHPRLSKWLPR